MSYWWRKLGYETYKDYLQSKTWKSISRFVRDLHQNECQICGSIYELQAHHLEYKPATIFGGSRYKLNKFMTLLCKRCHEEVHKLQHEQNLTITQATKKHAGRYGKRRVIKTKNQVRAMFGLKPTKKRSHKKIKKTVTKQEMKRRYKQNYKSNYAY